MWHPQRFTWNRAWRPRRHVSAQWVQETMKYVPAIVWTPLPMPTDSSGKPFGISPKPPHCDASAITQNVLLAGDRLYIPALREKTCERPTDQKHRFVRRGAPAMFRLRLLEDGVPRAGESYVLKLDHHLVNGTLDRSGLLEISIRPGTRTAEIKVGDDSEFVILKLGAVDPVTEVTSIQGRLSNLGFDPGAIDGVYGPKMARALKDFQHRCKLPLSSEPDRATRDGLVEEHGC